MRVHENGCAACIGVVIIIILVVKIGGCIWDGAQEVLAERHVKQERADARARARAAQKAVEEAAAEARAAEVRHAREAAMEKRRREEVARREAEAKKIAAAKREASKADKLRTFAMTDAPGIWRAYQDLEAAIAEQDVRIKDLATTLKEFDKDPEKDADYLALCVSRGEMKGSLDDIRRNLEEAYLAYCRFKATPSHKEYAELMKKALDHGTRAAEAATRKFEQMKVDK